MLGAIIGDIVGSRFEGMPIKTKAFDFFDKSCHCTDDSIMTLAIASALMAFKKNDCKNLAYFAIRNMKILGHAYPNAGYGISFGNWLRNENPQPYHSCGNGSAMRVSPCGFIATSLDEVKKLSFEITFVTHNHLEGIKGAEATAVAVFLSRQGNTKEKIKNYIYENYYPIDFTLNEVRDKYRFDETCQKTVPYALEAFFEAENYEDAIRNAISLGGDSDTLAAITGGIAEAYFGIPNQIKEQAFSYLDKYQKTILHDFYELLI